MVRVFDKADIREQIESDDIFNLLLEWGGNPTWSGENIISDTICHNEPGEGSAKLYYYPNGAAGAGLFHCYTGGCENASFDIFELVVKVFGIQKKKEMDLNDAVRYIAARLGIAGTYDDGDATSKIIDWDILSNYERIKQVEVGSISRIQLEEYDINILNKFNYNIKLTPWLAEGINQEVLDMAGIGYYVGGDQITIPHFDADGRFVGLRGRTMCLEEAERFGKYRPLKIGKTLYNHPLGLNLYGYSWAKENISQLKKAIVLESEKAVLQYMSYFGLDNSIAVACCGSNLSAHQMQFLLNAGAEEVVIAFDKQYAATGTDESLKWSRKLQKIHSKYKKDCALSFIWDKNELLGYKASPTDAGAETFLKLFKERIVL